jgi:hypothetical protein
VESLPSKRRILKKKRERKKREKKEEKKRKKEQGLKSKRGETSYEAPCFKRRKEKKEDEIYKLLGKILSKERKKGDHIFL